MTDPQPAVASTTNAVGSPLPGNSQEMASPVVELRQYTLHPGARDTLIGLFDRHFVEPQEEAGMTLIGQFRNLDLPDLFVWLRGFPDMESRRKSLAEFYGGPVWAAHRDTANATMIDSDDVLLLKPAWDGAGFNLTEAKRPAPAASANPSPSKGISTALFTAAVWHPAPEGEDEFISRFHREAMPLLAALGAPTIAAFVTEHAENTFPRLPVRANENVFVVFIRFDDAAALQRHDEALAKSAPWQAFLASIRQGLTKPAERLRLSATARSRLR
jgi:hypothetical protein